MPRSPHQLRRATIGGLTGALVTGVLALGFAAPASASPSSYVVSATIALPSPVSDGLAIDSTHHKAYVTHPGQGTVSVVDLTTNTVTATIAVGSQPFRIALDEARDRAYVSNTGTQPSPGPGDPIDTITEIDTTTDTVVRTIGGLWAPRGMAVDPSTHLLYAAEYLGNQDLAVIDPTADPVTVSRTALLESRPWAVDVDPLRHRAYVTTLFGGTLSTVEGTSVLSTQYAYPGPTNVTVDPATQQAYVVAGNGVSVVDLSDDQPEITDHIPGGSQPSDVALDPSTGTLLITDLNGDSVSVYDQATRTHERSVAVGSTPAAIEFDPATHRAYALNVGSQSISVIQAPIPQAITFTSTAPTAAKAGDSYTVTATGGGSGAPVTFSTTSPACTVSSEGAVSFQHTGPCDIAADQAGSGAYLAAPTAVQAVSVALAPTSIRLELDWTDLQWGDLVIGQTWSTDVPGLVQYYVDGEAYGDPQHVESPLGYTTLPNEIGSPDYGTHTVKVVLTPTDQTTYATSTDTVTFTVSRIQTVTELDATADRLSATVTRARYGYPLISGDVDFYVRGVKVGSAPVVDDVASLDRATTQADLRRVTAVFPAQAHFARSSDTTVVANPTLTATRSSATAPRNGWYRSPVTVTFHCTAAGAPLTAPCPAPVTLSHSGARQSVTRTVMAQDGGIRTISVKGINIDRAAPSVRLAGVRNGATYLAGGPRATCRASDALSGLAGCKVTRTRSGSRLVFTARATDRAGNVSSARAVARSVSVWVDGARVRGGHQVVRAGRTYTVLVAAAHRPSYVFAAPAPNRPYGGEVPFKRVGKQRWALGVTFTRSMLGHDLWNIGTRVGSRLTVTTVRVIR